MTKHTNKMKAILGALLFLYATTVRSQLTVNTAVTNAQLVAGFIGKGIAVSNITKNCPTGACGTFINGNSANLGMDRGVVFTNGDARAVSGMNNTNAFDKSYGIHFNDPDLIKIDAQAHGDPCILTLNVVPSCNTLTIKFRFGSEEYPEFINQFNDVFGFFVTGPNPAGGTYSGYNIARTPTTTTGTNVVSINNINNGYKASCVNPMPGPCTNCSYYISNCGGTLLQYDGITTVITASLSVIPCATYAFKIAIADAHDTNLDSGVFIEELYCSSSVTTTTNSSPTCPSCTGTATINASNGEPPYTYLWSNGQTTSTATGLCAGTYSVTVSDKTNCILNSNVSTVTVGSLTPGIPSIQSITNISCYGTNTGSATATVSGGTAPYSYVWSNGMTSQTATGLAAGNYTVTVYDNNNCSSTKTVSITQPLSPLTANLSITNVACSGNLAGASISPSGGSPNYYYSWSNGNTSAAITGLTTGDYTVTTTDARGCTSQQTFSIDITSTPTISASSTQAGCAVANGSASAIVLGGSGSPDYLWNPGGQTTNIATGLSVGTYTVTATSSGCSSNTSVSILPTANPSVTTSTTNTGCTVANGTATANPSGGTGMHTYLWSPSNQTTTTATGLFAGVYTIKITDENGCTTSNTATVIAAGGPTASTTVNSNVSCFAGKDGKATVIATGGTPNYTYSWDNGATANSISGLPAGTYIATVTDANGCVYSAAAIIVTQPTQSLTATTTPLSNVSCFGGSDGIGIANPSGGTPTYLYLWGNGQTTKIVTGLSMGTYSVNITDSLGCKTTNSVTISQPSIALSNTISTQTNVSCFGGGDGTASANTLGGTPGYSYLWNNGQTTTLVTGLSAGSYTVTVTDTKGCTTTSIASITQPLFVLTSNILSQTHVLCFGGNNGTITLNASGGTPNYNYLWSNGQSTNIITGLSAGSYTVSITDALGCTASNSVSITQPLVGLSNTMSPQTNVACYGGKDAMSTSNPLGGTQPYSFLWNNGQTTSTATGLNAGIHTVFISDVNGCSLLDTVIINQPGIFLSSTTSTQIPIACNGGSSGTVIVFPAGGTPPYSYLWSNGNTSQQVSGLSQGTYSVIVTDVNGCDTTNSVILLQPTVINTSVLGTDSICPGSKSLLTASSTGGTPGYNFNWQPGSLLGANVNVIPNTTTTYSAVATDANGCTAAAALFTVAVMPQAIAKIDTLTTGGIFDPIYYLSNPRLGNINWLWNFGDGTTSLDQKTTHKFPDPGSYHIIHITNNQYGCPDTAYLELFIPDTFFIPNVFTPSGNNINENWHIPNRGMKRFNLSIYDRWGIKVFESFSPDMQWDGRTASGNLLSDGTYYFTLYAEIRSSANAKPKVVAKTGPITLLTHDK